MKCLKRVRKNKNRDAKIVQFYAERTSVMEHMGNNHEEKICNIENQIANEACAIVKEETRGLETGGYNPAHLWKLKN